MSTPANTPANKIDWPVRCEAVLRAEYGEQFDNGMLRVVNVKWQIDEHPEWLLGYRNFGQKSLKQMREIIEREMGEAG